MQKIEGQLKVYLRRSTDKQEASLKTQFQWASKRARELGLKLEATERDLDELRTKGLLEHRGIYVDDGISGADLQRPAFQQLVRTATSNSGITHIFVYHRDRLARPEDATDMLKIEQQISRAGVTLVFAHKIVEPTQRGKRTLGHQVESLFEYDNAGQYLELLAERTIVGLLQNANKGFSTGGPAPYGHDRVLVDGEGNVLEVLAKGKAVRQPNCRVRWLPGQTEKSKAELKSWLYVMDLYNRKWGLHRIAKHLNDLQIPSPAAGKQRSVKGVSQVFSGLWNHKAVKSLIENPLLRGVKTFGASSSGRFRRVGPDGSRLLDNSDYDHNDRRKRIVNDDSIVLRAPSGSEPSIDEGSWLQAQKQLRERGQVQHGISRAKTLDANPLGGHVFDLTDGCNSPMYLRTLEGRRWLFCGAYSRSNGQECNRNAVDLEALEKFTVGEIVRQATAKYTPAEIRSRLTVLAAQTAENPRDQATELRAQLEQRCKNLEVEIAAIGRNLARASDDTAYKLIEKEFTASNSQLVAVRQQLAAIPHDDNHEPLSPDQRVAAAEALLEAMGAVQPTAEGRLAIKQLADDLNLKLGLTFTQAIIGTKRRVSRLIGGVMAFGDHPLPAHTQKSPAGPDIPPDNGSNSPKTGPGGSGTSEPAELQTPADQLSAHRGDCIIKGRGGYPAPTAGQAGQWHPLKPDVPHRQPAQPLQPALKPLRAFELRKTRKLTSIFAADYTAKTRGGSSVRSRRSEPA